MDACTKAPHGRVRTAPPAPAHQSPHTFSATLATVSLMVSVVENGRLRGRGRVHRGRGHIGCVSATWWRVAGSRRQVQQVPVALCCAPVPAYPLDLVVIGQASFWLTQ